MIKIAKSTLTRHWQAGYSSVAEYLGPYDPDTDYQFMTKDAAYQFAYKRIDAKLKDEWVSLRDRYKGLASVVHSIRATFSKSFREKLNAYREKIRAAELAWIEGPDLRFVYIPDELTAEGLDLPNGTALYRVDTYNPSMQEFVITGRTVSYYAYEGITRVRYELNVDKTVAATLKSEFSNYSYYLDRAEAVMVLRGLLEQRLADIGEQLKSL